MIVLGPKEEIQLGLTRVMVRFGAIQALAPTESARPLTQEEMADVLGGIDTPAGVPPGEDVSASLSGLPERIQILRVRLVAPVVTARLMRASAGVTWEVPAHKVGHAQSTAMAGARGNAVLLGHVSSLNAGNVFKELDGVRMGDEVLVHGGGATFQYRVTEIRRVPRDENTVMAQGEDSVLTLLTCTGTWLPDVHDYSHRLAVRAVLVT